MKHKITFELFDVHKYFKVSFFLFLDDIEDMNVSKYKFPVINKFIYNGIDYLKIAARGYISVDISSYLDKNEGYNPNRYFILDQKSQFFFIEGLKKLLSIFMNMNIKLYTIDSETHELILNRTLANQYSISIRVGSSLSKVVKLVPAVVEQDNIQYEGCCLYINSLDNLTYLTVSEIQYLVYKLESININQLSIDAINTFFNIDSSDSSEKENIKLEPVNEEKQDDNVGNNKIIRVEKSTDIEKELEVNNDVSE